MSDRHERRVLARLSHLTEVGKAAALRALAAVGFVAGVASFFYGLTQDERTKWYWLLGGLVIVVIFGKFALGLVKQAVFRYRNYPRVLDLLAQAQSDAETLGNRLDSAVDEIGRAWRNGIGEGHSQVMGFLASDGVPLQPRHFDIVQGVVCISAKPTESPPLVRARYSLVHIDTQRVLAIFTVSQVSDDVCLLTATSDSADEAWERVTSTAVAGARVPPGLVLRPSALDDYSELPNSAPQVDGQGDS